MSVLFVVVILYTTLFFSYFPFLEAFKHFLEMITPPQEEDQEVQCLQIRYYCSRSIFSALDFYNSFQRSTILPQVPDHCSRKKTSRSCAELTPRTFLPDVLI